MGQHFWAFKECFTFYEPLGTMHWLRLQAHEDELPGPLYTPSFALAKPNLECRGAWMKTLQNILVTSVLW